MRVLQTIPNAATNKLVQRSQQNITYELARLELALGRLPTAEQMAHTAVQLAQALVTMDLQNKFWLEQLCFAQNLLAEVQVSAGNLVPARENSRGVLPSNHATATPVSATMPRLAKTQRQSRS